MTSYFEVTTASDSPTTPLLTHMPHAATAVPSEWREQIVLDDEDLEEELLSMTDRYTDELFTNATTRDGTLFVNRLSRLVFDPERFPEDSDEPMSEKGMGAVYIRRQDGRPLREAGFSADARRQIMEELFSPYATALEHCVAETLEAFGTCTILDGHSFPTEPHPYENPHLARPDICLGYEPFHCPTELINALQEACGNAGFTCALNEPFAGSYVPLSYYQKESAVQSIMIEVRRGLYMDESTGEKLAAFGEVKNRIEELSAIVSVFAARRIRDFDTASNDELWNAYRTTTFEASIGDPQGPLAIRIGQHSSRLDALLEAHAAKSWIFITAWNPGPSRPDRESGRLSGPRRGVLSRWGERTRKLRVCWPV